MHFPTSGHKKYKTAILCALALLLFLVCYRCPFLFFLGIPCPGCGMSRALLALLRLDLKSAFHYHPLFWIVPLLLPLFLVMMIRYKKGQTTWLSSASFQWIGRFLIVSVCLLFFIVYLIRLCSGSDVVHFDLEHALFWRLYQNLFSGHSYLPKRL